MDDALVRACGAGTRRDAPLLAEARVDGVEASRWREALTTLRDAIFANLKFGTGRKRTLKHGRSRSQIAFHARVTIGRRPRSP